jgi:hypothetical protein
VNTPNIIYVLRFGFFIKSKFVGVGAVVILNIKIFKVGNIVPVYIIICSNILALLNIGT